MGRLADFIKSLSWYNRVKFFFMLFVWGWCGTFGGALIGVENLIIWALVMVVMWMPFYLIIKAYRVGYLFLLLILSGAVMPMILLLIEYGFNWGSVITLVMYAGICVFAIVDCVRTPVSIGAVSPTLIAVAQWGICVVAILWFGLMGMGAVLMDDDIDDYVLQQYHECVETRTAKGYPDDEVRQFCSDISWGCADKVYSPDCDPDVFCCLDSEAEHKKWNYLD